MNRILIIEDELETANTVKEALALEDISADIALNGEEGLQKFEKENYDLILLDLKMPGLSCEEVLSAIRKKDPFVDVIIYTNYKDFADVKKLTNIGIEGYINKGPSTDLIELLDAIKNRLAPLSDESISALLKDVPNTEE